MFHYLPEKTQRDNYKVSADYSIIYFYQDFFKHDNASLRGKNNVH